jgi:HEXXH motif-containing protein
MEPPMTPEQVKTILGSPDPAVTETLMAKSCVDRFDDLCAVAPIIRLIDGAEAYAAAMDGLIEDISDVGPAVDERLRSPILRGWLWRFGQVDAWSVDNPFLLEILDLIDNVRFGFSDESDWEGLFAIHNGVCMTWDTRLAIAGLGEGVAFVSKRGNEVAIKTEDGRILTFDLADQEDSRIRRTEFLPQSNIAVRNDLPLLHLHIREDGIPQRADGVTLDYDHRLTSYGPFDMDAILSAADLVRRAWPEEYSDWMKTLRVVVPRLEPPHAWLSGFSAFSHQGAIWLGPRSKLELLDALVHEQCHVKLRYLENTEMLLDEAENTMTFKVGWRPDPRPLVGIYEGVYVNLHVCEAMGRVVAQDLVGPAERDQLVAMRRKHSEHIREALEMLKAHARFTEAGQGFMDWALESSARLREMAEAA